MGQITEVTVEEAAESLRLFPLTLDEARDLLKRAVETQGEDFIYNPSNLYDCIYTPVDPMDLKSDTDPRGQTGCLIGVVLGLMGIEVNETFNSYSIPILKENHGWSWPTKVVEYFAQAQISQDVGKTWGRAYEDAELAIPRILRDAKENNG